MWKYMDSSLHLKSLKNVEVRLCTEVETERGEGKSHDRGTGEH